MTRSKQINAVENTRISVETKCFRFDSCYIKTGHSLTGGIRQIGTRPLHWPTWVRIQSVIRRQAVQYIHNDVWKTIVLGSYYWITISNNFDALLKLYFVA